MNRELIQQTESLRTVIVETGAKELLVASNKVTSLEVTSLLKKKVAQFHWTKDNVGEILDQIEAAGKLTSESKGSYKIYSSIKGVKLGKEAVEVSAISKTSIGRKQALELMRNNKGRFFTATFVNKENNLRTINAQYLKDQGTTDLGYVKVRETSKMKGEENSIRQINLQTLEELSIGGKTFKVG